MESEQLNKIQKMNEQMELFFHRIQPYFQILWKRKKKIIYINASVATIASVLLILFPSREYTCKAVILPDYGNKLSMLGGLSDLASMAGIGSGMVVPTQIYEQILKGDSILVPVIYTKYKTMKYDSLVNLVEYWDLTNAGWIPDSLQNRYKLLKAIEILIKKTKTDFNIQTQVLLVQVTLPEGKLAASVLNGIVESLDKYIRTRRKSNASYQVFYLERRSEQVEDSLNVFEERLSKFREQNTMLPLSPRLQLAQDRLTRKVEILRFAYNDLQQKLEVAKIEVVRDTPILNVREFVDNPVIPSSLSLKIQLIIILFFSLTLSGAYYIFELELKSLVFKIQSLFQRTIKGS